MPVGGYSPEGSTYHEQVVQPITTLSALLLEETTGEPVFTEGVAPANLPVLKLLDTSYRMIGPAGLLPAWDAYGYQYATVKSGLTYLARRTNDPGPLATIRAHRMWYRHAHPAWEIDDRLWTLVWWPERLDARLEEKTVPASPLAHPRGSRRAAARGTQGAPFPILGRVRRCAQFRAQPGGPERHHAGGVRERHPGRRFRQSTVGSAAAAGSGNHRVCRRTHARHDYRIYLCCLGRGEISREKAARWP